MARHLEQKNQYLVRINQVISYARKNLNGDLSLNVLAEVAGFSPFHFHRIFKAISNETVNEMVMRLRLERAVKLLRSSPELSITDAAFESGYKSIAVFSRAFKKSLGINAKSWDRVSPLEYSKNGQLAESFGRYILEDMKNLDLQEEFDVDIRSLPAQKLAYIRVYDSYSSFSNVQEAYWRLISWYREKGGDLENIALYGMAQDDPEVTPLQLCRFDWCVSAPNDWRAEGEVAIENFPACQVATVRCKGSFDLEYQILQYLFRSWLPQSQYQPANLPSMEIYHRMPEEMNWKEFDIDCAVPVEVL